MGFRHVNDREPSFIAHLPGPHLTRSCRAFSTTFKTTVFSQRPLPWFRAFFRKTALEGQQTSISHAAPQSTRPPFPSRLASCVRVHKPRPRNRLGGRNTARLPTALEESWPTLAGYHDPVAPEFRPRAVSVLSATVAHTCLLYTSDAADEEDSVDLGGRRI